MSDYERHSGKIVELIPMDDEKTEHTLKRVLGDKFNGAVWQQTGSQDLYLETENIPFFKIKGITYVVLNNKKHDTESDFVNLIPRSDGSFDFVAQFYNGATYLEEMLEEEIERHEKTNSSGTKYTK